MSFNTFDYVLILLFFLYIIYIIISGSKSNQTFPHFFNAGGKLNWLMIGVSILGTNITFEYLMNSASDGYSIGLAYGSYEWTASIIIIIIALYFVPPFLRIGVLTLPEYLEYRYNRSTRVIMAILFLFFQFGMIIPILISNAFFIEYIWGIPKIVSISFIALTGGAIIFSGGLASKIRLDLMVVFLLFFSSIVLLVLCFIKIEGLSNFINLADGRLETILPSDHEVLPWTGVFIGGLWILHLQYWAFYQPIGQAVLASASLSEAQKGLLFVASFKILTPIILLVPGIIGYELFSDQITSMNYVLPVVIKNVAPYGLGGIIIIGYLSTMFATFTGYLNATVVILSNDILQHFIEEQDKKNKLIRVAKLSTLVIVALSVLITSIVIQNDDFFWFIKLLFLMVAPISTSVFLFAIFSRRTPTFAATIAMISGIPLFFLFKEYLPYSLLNISGITFLVLFGFMIIIRLASPLSAPVVMPEKFAIKFERNLSVEIWGIFIITIVCGIYAFSL